MALMNVTGRKFRLTLDNAGNQLLQLPGHSMVIRRASSASVQITAWRDEKAGDGEQLRLGEGFRHFPFGRLYLEWDAQAGGWVELYVSGSPEDADPDLSEVIIAAPPGDSTIVNTALNPVPVTLPASQAVQITNTPDVFSTERPDTFPAAGEWVGDSVIYNTTTFTPIYVVPAGKTLRLETLQVESQAFGYKATAQVRQPTGETLTIASRGGQTKLRKVVNVPQNSIIEVKIENAGVNVHCIWNGKLI